MRAEVLRLYPTPAEAVALEGLYLGEELRTRQPEGLIYTNYIMSLDGRIAVTDPDTGERRVPEPIKNPRDWRLFQELAAQADVLILTARYLRDLARGQAQDVVPVAERDEFADLLAWREAQGLTRQPALAVVTEGLELPSMITQLAATRDLVVLTGSQGDAERRRNLEQAGIRVQTVGAARWVPGEALVDALRRDGHRFIYSIGGPHLFHALLSADVLDRLYLTLAHRLLGGPDYDTLLAGALLPGAPAYHLTALHYDTAAPGPAGQLLARFDHPRQRP